MCEDFLVSLEASPSFSSSQLVFKIQKTQEGFPYNLNMVECSQIPNNECVWMILFQQPGK